MQSPPQKISTENRHAGFRTHSARISNTDTPSRVPAPASLSATQRPSQAPAAPSTRNAPPMKKRAKGSGFLGMLFLIAFGSLGYFVWTTLLQYQAFGVVEGRVISVGAPWAGTISSWQVRDGDVVTQGQVLAQISNLDLQHQLETLTDELKLTQAQLDAEISKVKFEIRDYSDRNQEAIASYLKSHGELLAEKAKAKELERKINRIQRLMESNNASKAQYEKAFFQLAGQRKKVEKLQQAVDVLKTRSDAENSDDDGRSRLRPMLAQIEAIQSQITRVRQRIDQGQIKAPVSGRVSKRHCLTGESALAGQTVIDILEDNSIEAVLYVPQRLVDEFEVGADVALTLAPHRQPLVCTVDRFGDQFGPAPASIESYYSSNQPLLPIYLKPNTAASSTMAMRIGGTIKRPYQYDKAIAQIINDAKSFFAQFNSTSQPASAQPSSGEPTSDQPAPNQPDEKKLNSNETGDIQVAFTSTLAPQSLKPQPETDFSVLDIDAEPDPSLTIFETYTVTSNNNNALPEPRSQPTSPADQPLETSTPPKKTNLTSPQANLMADLFQ